MDAPTLDPALVADLKAAVGAEHVSTAISDRLANSRGVWPIELKQARGPGLPPMPAAVVWPGDAAEVSAVLRLVNTAGVAVVAFGGGSGIVGGTTPAPGCLSLDTKRLNGLRVETTSLVAYAGAGLWGADLERSLNEQGLSLGHFPQSLFSSTVGGWVATRASGTFSTLHGNIEDMMLGLEVVLADGTLVRTPASPRSATGPNLNELFLGSEGTLGVVTEVALSVHRAAEWRLWDSFAFEGFECALDALRCMLQTGLRPAAVRLYDPAETAHKFGGFDLPPESCVLVLVYEGLRELVEVSAALGRRDCERQAGRYLGSTPAEHWWQTRFDTSGMVLANSRPGGISDAIEVAALWRDLPAVYAAMTAAARRHGAAVHAHVSHVYPAGGALYVIVSAQAQDDEAAVALYRALVDDLLAACLAAGGRLSHHHGIGLGRAHWMRAEHGEAGLGVLRALKQTLDPRGILNPGKLIPNTTP
jgi:alkyldihydroxyacetonephosphate synthase